MQGLGSRERGRLSLSNCVSKLVGGTHTWGGAAQRLPQGKTPNRIGVGAVWRWAHSPRSASALTPLPQQSKLWSRGDVRKPDQPLSCRRALAAEDSPWGRSGWEDGCSGGLQASPPRCRAPRLGAQRTPHVPSWKLLLGVPDEAGVGRKSAEDRQFPPTSAPASRPLTTVWYIRFH